MTKLTLTILAIISGFATDAFAAKATVQCPALQGTYNCKDEMLPMELKTEQVKGVTVYTFNGQTFITDGQYHSNVPAGKYKATCDSGVASIEVLTLDEQNPKCQDGFTVQRTIWQLSMIGERMSFSENDSMACPTGAPTNDIKTMCDLQKSH